MKKILYVVLGATLSAPLVASAQYGYGYNMMGYQGGMGNFGIFMTIGGIVWTIVGILAIVWLWQHIEKK